MSLVWSRFGSQVGSSIQKIACFLPATYPDPLKKQQLAAIDMCV